MRRSADLFPEIRKIRNKPRVLMHFTNVSINDCVGSPILADMKCSRCGHNDGYWEFDTVTEVKRGIPCPVCNNIQQ